MIKPIGVDLDVDVALGELFYYYCFLFFILFFFFD